MVKMMSIEELNKKKHQALLAQDERDKSQILIFIGTGTCGLAAGAGETLEQIQIELEKRNVNAMINTVGCIGICVNEPIVDIQLPGQARVTYANVKREMIARIIDEHVISGNPVQEWVTGVIPADW